LAFSIVSAVFSMFHGFFHCLTAGNNGKGRETLLAAVKHCSTGFSIVSARGEVFQAAVARIRPAHRAIPPLWECA
jgi:hypothetical protein